MSKFTTIEIVVVLLAILVVIAVVSILGWDSGYRRAYIDLHSGKIEDVVRKDMPALWIKYNAPSKQETK